eukprot:9224191-Alexandrium_andersonii.AAC.1
MGRLGDSRAKPIPRMLNARSSGDCGEALAASLDNPRTGSIIILGGWQGSKHRFVRRYPNWAVEM